MSNQKSKSNCPVKPKLRHHPRPVESNCVDKLTGVLVAAFGTWQMFVLHTMLFVVWVFYDHDMDTLTFWVSIEAILLALLILMSQKRQVEEDRRRAMKDLEIDRHAEKATRELIEMVREIGVKVGIRKFKIDKKDNGLDAME